MRYIFTLSFRKIFQKKNLSGNHCSAYSTITVAKPVGERGDYTATDGLLTVLLKISDTLKHGFRARISTEMLHGMTRI